MVLWLGIFVLSGLVILLVLKIILMRRSAEEIRQGFSQRLTEDTNTLIDISSQDRQLRALANDMNRQLRLLRQERRRCRQGDQELKDAITSISHDLRTPLTAICGYLDLLEREDMSRQAREYLSRIRSRTSAMNGLTEELFRYSVVTTVQELTLKRLDLVRTLEESLLSFYGAMEGKGIHPQVRLPEAPVWRELDPEAVNRVFSNIISNALKYSDGDFSVTMADDGGITFSNSAKELNAVMAGRLFDRFYTVNVSRNSTGLGLSIAKLLTQRMGGKIDAEYQGSTLSIRVFFPPTNIQ